MKPDSISIEETMQRLLQAKEETGFIDVRSEGEWSSASSPGFTNIPVLRDDERHQVGICYKQHGQKEAILLGEQLVAHDLENRLNAWKHAAGDKKALICCWRGGMRSGRVAEFLLTHGIPAATVAGGYKAIRNVYLGVFEGQLPAFVILSGLTGVNKTGLLNDVPVSRVDLEGIANHRGSTFGGYSRIPQPAQTSFENQLAFEILKSKKDPVLLEDESVQIGRVRLPNSFREAMSASSLIILEASMQQRVAHIFEEYILSALKRGETLDEILQFALHNLNRIEKKLGGKAKHEMETLIKSAFSKKVHVDNHAEWISLLLETYYDPMYIYSLKRRPRPILFQGDYQACRNWIQTNLPSV